jgi:hypothetical protein
MGDFVFVGLVLAFFAVSLGLIAACQRLMEG